MLGKSKNAIVKKRASFVILSKDGKAPEASTKILPA
jgi:hypothetical protein